MAAHGRVLAVGAGQQVGIGGSLNAGDRQLQQNVPEDDGPAAGLPGAPVQQGGVQQALGDEIGDADEQKLAALAVFPAPRQRQLDDEGDAQPPEETDDLLMRAVGFIQGDLPGGGGNGIAVGAGEGQCGDLGGGFAAQIQTVDAIEGIALGDGAAKEGITFGEVEQQLELLRGEIAPSGFVIAVALLEQILQKIVAVGVLVVHEFLPCGIGGVVPARFQHIGQVFPRLVDAVRAIGIHLGQHGDIVILIGHTGKGE